jgi:hypothetical protein
MPMFQNNELTGVQGQGKFKLNILPFYHPRDAANPVVFSFT